MRKVFEGSLLGTLIQMDHCEAGNGIVIMGHHGSLSCVLCMHEFGYGFKTRACDSGSIVDYSCVSYCAAFQMQSKSSIFDKYFFEMALGWNLFLHT